MHSVGKILFLNVKASGVWSILTTVLGHDMKRPNTLAETADVSAGLESRLGHRLSLLRCSLFSSGPQGQMPI